MNLKFSMNVCPVVFGLFRFLRILLGVNQICVSTSRSCSCFMISLYVFYQNIDFVVCHIHIVFKNYMLIIQVLSSLCLFSIEIQMNPYIMIETENNCKIVWYNYWRKYILQRRVTKLFAIDNTINFLPVYFVIMQVQMLFDIIYKQRR